VVYKFRLEELDSLIKDLIKDSNEIEHSGRTVIEHLIGTYNILDSWNCNDDVKLAGALHNAYGTEKFKFHKSHATQRNVLKEKVGVQAEFLVFIFSKLIWSLFIEGPPETELKNYSRYFSGVELVSYEEFSGVILIFFANIIEQIAVIPSNKKKYFMLLAERYKLFLSVERLELILIALR
jgi:hypothetical protein